MRVTTRPMMTLHPPHRRYPGANPQANIFLRLKDTNNLVLTKLHLPLPDPSRHLILTALICPTADQLRHLSHNQLPPNTLIILEYPVSHLERHFPARRRRAHGIHPGSDLVPTDLSGNLLNYPPEDLVEVAYLDMGQVRLPRVSHMGYPTGPYTAAKNGKNVARQ